MSMIGKIPNTAPPNTSWSKKSVNNRNSQPRGAVAQSTEPFGVRS